ncbi:tetratricopeptide repeat protein [Nitritalea halalkaliphila]|uniref:tetratricopeptide repeat protein n=1 Tax=Nitritalea halalkaliphila TaxID=590849 RepID=UPI0002DD2982|nr:tetratricopeptide repeat protein [Nitritalea halalkaliphila]
MHQFSAARFTYERFAKDTLYADQRLEAQFKRAVSALEAEDEDAEGLFQSFVRTHREHPRSSEAAFYLGNFRFDKRDYAGALRAFSAVRAADVWPEQRDETTFKQGYAHMQLKQDRQALHYFNYLKERQATIGLMLITMRAIWS